MNLLLKFILKDNGEENVKFYPHLLSKDCLQDLPLMETILMIDIKVSQKAAIIL